MVQANALTAISLLAIFIQQIQGQIISNLPGCVQDCINSSGDFNCSPLDIPCICRISAGNFLPDIVVCSKCRCDNALDLNLFLTPLQLACSLSGQSIPGSAVVSAEEAQSGTPVPSQCSKYVTTTGGGSSATTSADSGSGSGSDSSSNADSATQTPAPTAVTTTTTDSSGSTVVVVVPISIVSGQFGSATSYGSPSTMTDAAGSAASSAASSVAGSISSGASSASSAAGSATSAAGSYLSSLASSLGSVLTQTTVVGQSTSSAATTSRAGQGGTTGAGTPFSGGSVKTVSHTGVLGLVAAGIFLGTFLL